MKPTLAKEPRGDAYPSSPGWLASALTERVSRCLSGSTAKRLPTQAWALAAIPGASSPARLGRAVGIYGFVKSARLWPSAKRRRSGLQLSGVLRKLGARPDGWSPDLVLAGHSRRCANMVPARRRAIPLSDLNDLYRRVINHNNRLKRCSELKRPEMSFRNETDAQGGRSTP